MTFDPHIEEALHHHYVTMTAPEEVLLAWVYRVARREWMPECWSCHEPLPKDGPTNCPECGADTIPF